ncbi:ABC transporter ATP-binding protein [Actinoplanes sp. NPDC049548]|uniref:ABC transporter ATP-binding protein n=1 Tax=Actinoplanes sp. NPDC049548 TaxID=3155152 RepID=UPI00343E67A0
MSVLSAQAAGVRSRRRWLFRDLDVAVSAGDVVAIVGPPGSGRTTALLALAQRFKLSAGRVDIAGTAALGHVPGVSEPESVLTVAEHVRERSLLAGRRFGGEVAWHGLDPGKRGWELSPYERQVLGLVLAQISQPQVVALDGVDEGLDAGEREALWRLIGETAARGVAVLVSAREVDETRVSTVVRLGGQAVVAPEPAESDTSAVMWSAGAPAEAGAGRAEVQAVGSEDAGPRAGALKVQDAEPDVSEAQTSEPKAREPEAGEDREVDTAEATEPEAEDGRSEATGKQAASEVSHRGDDKRGGEQK